MRVDRLRAVFFLPPPPPHGAGESDSARCSSLGGAADINLQLLPRVSLSHMLGGGVGGDGGGGVRRRAPLRLVCRSSLMTGVWSDWCGTSVIAVRPSRSTAAVGQKAKGDGGMSLGWSVAGPRVLWCVLVSPSHPLQFMGQQTPSDCRDRW